MKLQPKSQEPNNRYCISVSTIFYHSLIDSYITTLIPRLPIFSQAYRYTCSLNRLIHTMMQLKVRDILIGFPFSPQTQLATPRWGSAGDYGVVLATERWWEWCIDTVYMDVDVMYFAKCYGAHLGWCYYQTLRWMLVDGWCHFLPRPPMLCAELLFGSAEKWHLWLHHHGHDQIGAAKRNLAFPNVELVTAYASIDPAFAPGSWAFLSRGREPLDVKYLKYLEFVMKRCAMCRLACIGLPSSTV